MALGGGGGGNAGGIRAGRAYVELGANDKLSGQLKAIGGKFVEFGKLALSATGISGLLGGLSFKGTADDLKDMSDAAKALGISGRAASGLFGAIPGDFKENVEGLAQFSDAIQQALKDGGKTTALFEGLSISAKDLEGVPLDEQFYRIHDAIRQLPQSQQAYKLGLVGGTDSMKKWLPLLSMSNEELRAQAGRLSMTSAELEQAAAASKAMAAAGKGVEQAWQRVVVIVAPLVTSLAGAISGALAPAADWLSGRDLVEEAAIVLLQLRGLWLDLKHSGEEMGVGVADAFMNAWDVAILHAKNATAGLTDVVSGSIRKAVKVPLLVLGMFDREKAKQANDLLGAVEQTGPLAAKVLRDQALAEFTRNVDARTAVVKNMADQRALDKAVNDAAIAEMRDRRRQRAEASAFNDLMGRSVSLGAERLSAAGRSLGTFGSGSFLTQGYARQSASDPVKQMVAEQKKGNVTLGEIKNAVINSVPKFL